MNAHLWLRIATLATLAAASGCRRPLSDQQYQTIDAWLLCDECTDSLRAGVKALGGKAVYTLDRALIGPSPGRRANKEAQFRYMYAALPAPSTSESTYVAQLLSNYVAKYQAQAAISLGDIRDSRALAALQRASDLAAVRNYRADVVQVVNVVLALASSAAFTGIVNPVTVRFADTVRVARGAGLAWNGDESVILNGSPFSDSLIVARWATDSLAFLAIGRLGSYAVSVTGLGPNAVRQVRPLRIVPPGYVSHGSVSAPVVTADSFPQTKYLLLPSRPGDSTDFFRFEPATIRTVTATVTTSGLDPATLRWYACAPVALVVISGPTTTVTGYVVDERGEAVEGVDVTVPTLAASAVTDSLGRFVLSGLPVSPPLTLRAQKNGFRVSATSVQVAADSVQIGVVRNPLTAATAVNRHSSTLTIPAGACRFLEVRVPLADGPRALRLRLTSP